MHVYVSNIFGNPNIGLYCYCNDRFCLVPHGTSKSTIDKFKEVLKVPVHEASIAGTNLLGVFLAGNDNMLLVPEIAYEGEISYLKSLGINLTIVKSRLTALGNNIICSNAGCIANPEYSDKEIAEIGKALSVPAWKGTINGLGIVGSLAVVNSIGSLACNDISPQEKKAFETVLKISCNGGTINFGSSFISSGLITNSKGFIVGDQSSGPEIANADESLGFILQ